MPHSAAPRVAAPTSLFRAPPPAALPMRADHLIRTLALSPHPEGGWYRRLYRAELTVHAGGAPRAAVTSILYLLRAGETSRWHRIDADEIWHFYEGAPLTLWRATADFGTVEELALGPVGAAALPCRPVAAGQWQAARSEGDYTLVGCTFAPGFKFDGFSLLAGDPVSLAMLHTHAPHLAAPLPQVIRKQLHADDRVGARAEVLRQQQVVDALGLAGVQDREGRVAHARRRRRQREHVTQFRSARRGTVVATG